MSIKKILTDLQETLKNGTGVGTWLQSKGYEAVFQLKYSLDSSRELTIYFANKDMLRHNRGLSDSLRDELLVCIKGDVVIDWASPESEWSWSSGMADAISLGMYATDPDIPGKYDYLGTSSVKLESYYLPMGATTKLLAERLRSISGSKESIWISIGEPLRRESTIVTGYPPEPTIEAYGQDEHQATLHKRRLLDYLSVLLKRFD